MLTSVGLGDISGHLTDIPVTVVSCDFHHLIVTLHASIKCVHVKALCYLIIVGKFVSVMPTSQVHYHAEL